MKMLINSLELGGAERSLITLSKYLDMEIFTLYDNSMQLDIKYTPLIRTKRMSGILTYLYMPVFLLKARKFFATNDVIISHLNQSNFLNFIMKNSLGTKAIMVIHHLNLNRKIPFEKQVFKSADRIVCVSEHMRVDAIRRYENPNTITIHNPIDSDYIKDQATRGKYLDGGYIINIGRYVDFKNQKFLIDVYSKIRNRNDLKLLILGYGPLENELINLAKSRGFRVGRSPDEDADVYIFKANNPYVYLKGAKAYIHTSVMEGFGIVLLEALSLNIPVFTSDYKYGSREALGIYDFEFRPEYPYRTELGALLPVATDVNSREGQIWVESLPMLLEEYDRVPGERYIREKFSPEVIASRWRDIINSLE
ncbi:MAG: glycosyltransferase [Candidatus Anstonellales archaeon]